MSRFQKQRSHPGQGGDEMAKQARSGSDDLTLQQLLVNYMAMPGRALIEIDGRLFITHDAQRYMTAIVERAAPFGGQEYITQALDAIARRGQL